MKRRQRRPVLNVNGEQSDSPRRRWQNKYEQIAADHADENGGPSNPLANLVEQYNSDSETDEMRSGKKKLDEKVNDFFKEIQLIAPELPADEMARRPSTNVKESQENSARVPPTEPSTLWQECIDDSTGYPYYWHVETNEVTWDVPEEIRLLRDTDQQDSPNRTSYSTQWVNFTSNTYPQPQINIPEGMIPKEVVARNRNRQVSSQQNTQQDTSNQPNTSRNSVTKEYESDDGKIEMITSFGSDGTESETSDNDSPKKKTINEFDSRKIQQRTKPTSSLDRRNKESSSGPKKMDNNETSTNIGPLLPTGIIPLIHGPENSLKTEFERKKCKRKDDDETSSKSLEKFENLASEARTRGSENSSSVVNKTLQSKITGEKKIVASGKELKFSLVPGYADDSDAEEETSPKKMNEPLFPIAEFKNSTTTTISQSGSTLRKVETKFTDHGSIRIFEYQRTAIEKAEDLAEEIKQMNEELESDVQENFNVDETRVVRIEDEIPKPNIFLENLETPTKAFQRKRRIAFDVIPNKNRSTEVDGANKSQSVPSPPAVSVGNDTDRHGLGFQKESRTTETKDSNDANDRNTHSPTIDKSANASKSAINFVKGETMVGKTDEVAKDKTEAEIKQLKQIPETIMEKLKFLSEGGQPASAVQVMAIQLQTLLAAWDAGDLKDSYMENWLNDVARELGCLEEAAAPPGWNCQWDRSHKRYFYRNSTTGDAQWTYPDTDVIGGSEEMELCTTPPPQGQEEPCIIESQTCKSQDPAVTCTENEITSEETSIVGDNFFAQTAHPTAPPPPKISSPSPPPPPKIYRNDTKKGKKRRGSVQSKIPDTKKDKAGEDSRENDDLNQTVNPPLPPSPEKTSQPPLPPHPPMVPNPPNSEPLPPGVDPPDMPFALTAPSIETTMLYAPSGPQTNPIYAATIGDPGLLGHHTALMQGQLMHYPAYHHHLHNQALIAAANRLNGQEAVQFMVDYSQVYANTRIIAKPPTKSQKESLGSALDSFYSDIATMENVRGENEMETVLPLVETPPVPQIPQESDPPAILTDSVLKERKKKKAKLGISKKQKEVSSMVAKWQKAQHYQDND